jgi:hypothetical protein
VASRSVGRSFPDGPPDSLIAIAPGNELPNSPLSGDPRIDMTGAAPHRLGALAGRQAHGWARPPMHALPLMPARAGDFSWTMTRYVRLPSSLPPHTSIHHGCENLVCRGSTFGPICAMTGLAPISAAVEAALIGRVFCRVVCDIIPGR